MMRRSMYEYAELASGDVPHGTNIRDLHYTESVAKYSAQGIAARYPTHFSRLLCNAYFFAQFWSLIRG